MYVRCGTTEDSPSVVGSRGAHAVACRSASGKVQEVPCDRSPEVAAGQHYI